MIGTEHLYLELEFVIDVVDANVNFQNQSEKKRCIQPVRGAWFHPQGSASCFITFESHVFVFYSFIILVKLSNRKYNDRVRGA